MYKREYRFSEVIDDLKLQIAEWKSCSNLPILGLAKVKTVIAPLFHDGWMGTEVRAEVELRKDVRAISANVWLPDNEEPITMSLSFGEQSTGQIINPGVNAIRLDVRRNTNEIAELALIASSSRVAGPSDAREVSVIVDSIVFEG